MPRRTAGPPALWGRLLWLSSCLVTACLFAAFRIAAPSLLGTPSGTAVTATLAAAFTLVAALAVVGRARLDAAFCGDSRPARVAVRARIERTAFLPLRDPDAAGRPRPRAPGH